MNGRSGTADAHYVGERLPSGMRPEAVYLDCAATTPIDPIVREEVVRYLAEEFGNAGSRTHEYGTRARRAVEAARDRVARVVRATRGEVIFTSGATEANNIAILGLAAYGSKSGRRHLITTAIEHHAVLEPFRALESRGFEVTLLGPNSRGWIEPGSVRKALRPDTLLVSVMHANNETGVIQPIPQIAEILGEHDAFFHIDAAQGFGKDIESLRHPRADLISISGHKIHAPKGIGALVARKRGFARPPLEPLMHGGGQERGLRPGTLPVHLIAGLGKAAELALAENEARAAACREFRKRFLEGLEPLGIAVHGDSERVLPHILNFSIPGLDSETVMEAWRELAAVSDGAACTSQSYTCSHVLAAMGIAPEKMEGAIRVSWCHTSPLPDLSAMVAAIRRIRA